MNALEQFKKIAGIPAEFGAAQPYARLNAVDEAGAAGADADVEYDEDSERVRVTVTDWIGSVASRKIVMKVEFDVATGKIVGDEGDTLSDLLVAVDGMRVLGGAA